MPSSMSNRLDAFGRRHPVLFLALLVLMAIGVTLRLLYVGEVPGVLYQMF